MVIILGDFMTNFKGIQHWSSIQNKQLYFGIYPLFHLSKIHVGSAHTGLLSIASAKNRYSTQFFGIANAKRSV